MKLTKEQISAIAALPDDKLWREVVKIARSYGFSLPETTPPHDQLEKLRSAVTGGKISGADALKLLNNYKRGMKNG